MNDHISVPFVRKTSYSCLLKKQMLLHSTERLHKCTVCGRGFTKLSYLKSHILTHTGERPLKCIISGKDYRHPNNIKENMLIPTVNVHISVPYVGKTLHGLVI